MLAIAMLDICPSQNDSLKNPLPTQGKTPANNYCNGSNAMSEVVQDTAQL